MTSIRRRDRGGFLPALDEALIAIDGYAVVGTATLDASLLRYGEIDGSLEATSMNVAMNIGPRGVQLVAVEGLSRRFPPATSARFPRSDEV